MPIYTFYADPNDGQIASSDATYATAREGTGTLTPDTAGGTIAVGQQLATGTYTVDEGFLSFDTSVIPNAATIVSASLELYFDTVDNHSTTDFTIEARAHDWGTSLEAADYVAGSGLAAKPNLATQLTSGITTNAYKLFTSLFTFAGNINKTGFTRMVIASSRHRSGTTPTGDEYVAFHSADSAGTATDPKLTVVTVPAMTGELGTNSSKTTGTTIAITTTTGVGDFETIAVALAMDPAAGTVSATDTAGNTYTVLEDVPNGSGTSGVRLVILAALNTTTLSAGGTITVTHPSCAARAVSAAQFRVDLPGGAKVTSANATGSSTTPSVAVASAVQYPIIIGAVAVEGPSGDTYTPDAAFSPLTSAGTTGGAAGSNVTINWGWRGAVDEVDYLQAPTLGTSRLWAQAIIVLDSTTARILTFREEPGFRQSDEPGWDVVDAGVSYNPTTGYASELRMSIRDPALTVYYAVTIGGTVYGGTMTYGETVVALPASTMGVVIDAAGNVNYTGIDGGSIDLRIPA